MFCCWCIISTIANSSHACAARIYVLFCFSRVFYSCSRVFPSYTIILPFSGSYTRIFFLLYIHSVFAVVCLHSRPYCWLSFVLYLFLVHSILPLVSSSRTLVLSSCALTLVHYPFDISIATSARMLYFGLRMLYFGSRMLYFGSRVLAYIYFPRVCNVLFALVCSYYSSCPLSL